MSLLTQGQHASSRLRNLGVAYGNTKPLPLGTFTADIMSIDTGATFKTDFVATNGDDRRNSRET